jgi:hypothetical protein|tara:strand:+ start:1217 stop:1546 length:330 start_codon:yes stop_codon:yes gene_type:complete
MTKDQYLEMMEQMGEEPDWEKCPPDWSDFPDQVILAMNIFNSMGDRVYPEIGYIGKDYVNFEYLLKHYGIEEEHIKEYVYELLLWLDSRAIQESQKKLKAEYERMKRKH